MIRLVPRPSRYFAAGPPAAALALLVAGDRLAGATPPAHDAARHPASDDAAPAPSCRHAPPHRPTPAPRPERPLPPRRPPPRRPRPRRPQRHRPCRRADPFGEELTLAAKTVVYMKGTANWDAAFDTITSTLKTLQAALDKQSIKAAGSPLIVYTSTDDTGFVFQAEIPIAEAPKAPLGKDIANGKSPEGKALKFVHRGSYDNMDNTYEAITNHLDEKKLEAKDSFIEEYVTDPLKTAEDKLIINVYVPLK